MGFTTKPTTVAFNCAQTEQKAFSKEETPRTQVGEGKDRKGWSRNRRDGEVGEKLAKCLESVFYNKVHKGVNGNDIAGLSPLQLPCCFGWSFFVCFLSKSLVCASVSRSSTSMTTIPSSLIQFCGRSGSETKRLGRNSQAGEELLRLLIDFLHLSFHLYLQVFFVQTCSYG